MTLAHAQIFRLTILGISGLILLVTAGFLSIGWLASGDDLCGNDEIFEFFSPNWQLKEVYFRRNCGATTAYSSQVSILPSMEALPNEAGNVYAQRQVGVGVAKRIDDTHLLISGMDPKPSISYHTEFRGVQISYENGQPSQAPVP